MHDHSGSKYGGHRYKNQWNTLYVQRMQIRIAQQARVTSYYHMRVVDIRYTYTRFVISKTSICSRLGGVKVVEVSGVPGNFPEILGNPFLLYYYYA